MKKLSENEEERYSARVAVIIGVILSLSMGFLDIAISMLPQPSGFSSFSFILPPLVATISISFFIYMILWLLVIPQLMRFLKMDPNALAISLAVFLGTMFTLTSLSGLIHFPLDPHEFFELFIMFSICLLTSIATYFASKAFAHMSNYRKTVVIFSLALPFVLAQTMMFVWLHRYQIGSFFSKPSFLVNIGYILTVLFTLALFYLIGQILMLMRLLIAFMILIFLSPFVMLIAMQAPKYPLKEFKNKDHKIKHVILITVDTLRADALSCYGYQSESTLHIDQLARDGILFNRAISSAPWTLPAVASIMTGLSPSVHMTVEHQSKLSDILPTLAEYMRDAGYFTSGIGSNLLLTPNYKISQGFLEYNFFPKPSFGSSIGAKLLQRVFPRKFRLRVSTRDLTNLACKWLKENYEKDFFLWLHYFDPHYPYMPPTDFLPESEPLPRIGTGFSKKEEVISGHFVPSLVERDWIKELYGGEVRYVDKSIGRLLALLKRLNLYDESLIILTSDHGEEFWEHGSITHGHTLYHELLWVPLIIKPPESASKGEIITKVVSTTYIMPTILDLCRIKYETDYLSVGSLSSLWRPNPDTFDAQPIFSTAVSLYEDRESIIFDGLKYIRSLLTNREELYDLACDPKEQISIAFSSPETIQRAKNILRELNGTAKKLREHYGIMGGEEIKFDKEIIEKLKSLGYIR